MSTLGVAALVAAGIWLAVLTVVLLVLVRQMALLTAWAQEQGSGPGTRDHEGLEVGAEIPAGSLEVLPEMANGLCYVVFLSGNCQPCREFALEAGRSEELAELRDSIPVAAVITGGGALADAIHELLPSWFLVKRESDADRLHEDLEINQTPSVVEVERGRVTGKAVAGYGVVNFVNLVQARATSDAPDYAGPSLEVKSNGAAPKGAQIGG